MAMGTALSLVICIIQMENFQKVATEQSDLRLELKHCPSLMH
jgi:hypothetical protein